MARRPSPNELHQALSIAQAHQQEMERPESKDHLLRLDTDEEQIALRDLSSQRSPVQTRSPPTVLTGNATTGHHSRAGSEGIRGWRPRSQGSPTLERRDTLTMGRLYEKMGRLSIIPRYLVYILPLAAIIAIPLTIGALLPDATLGVRVPHTRHCRIYEDVANVGRVFNCCGFSFGWRLSGCPCGSPKSVPNASPSSSNTSSVSSPPEQLNTPLSSQLSKSPSPSSHGHSSLSSLLYHS